MGRAECITEYVRLHDRKLFCARDAVAGTLCIFRKTERLETYDVDGHRITFALPDRHMVCALTDNWSIRGNPVDWGLLPIMEHIRKIDLWSNECHITNLLESYKQSDIEKRKAIRSEGEAQADVFRHDFKKTFNDFNVNSLINKDAEKSRKDLKNGY